MGLLVGVALILSLIERAIPLPVPIPGAKLGLANVVTLVAIYTLDKKDVPKIIFSRVVLGAIFGGNASMIMYSLTGGVFSFIAMLAMKSIFVDKVSIIGVSAVGAVFHYIGQVFVAILVLESLSIIIYLPVLSIVGVIMGVFVGHISNYTVYYIISGGKIYES